MPRPTSKAGMKFASGEKAEQKRFAKILISKIKKKE